MMNHMKQVPTDASWFDENQLKSLLLYCTICGAKVDPTLTKESLVNGSKLSLKLHCFSGHTVTWKSQPDLTYVKGIGNLDIVAAVTFAGIPFAKFEKFAWLLKLKGKRTSKKRINFFWKFKKNNLKLAI